MAAVPLVQQDPRFWRDRRVLVTGCSGFLGAWLTRALLDLGARVVGLLREDGSTKPMFANGLADRVTPLRGSVADLELLAGALADHQVDVVFHLAAQAITSAAQRDPVGTLDTNIRGTWNVLEAARLSGTVRAMLIASSVKVYGAHPTLPFTEDTPLEGALPYDVSKIGAELVSSAYHRSFDLPVVITRCGNLYGGGDVHWDRIVPGTIRAAAGGRAPIVRSGGTPLRDYIYVEDAVDAFLRLAQVADAAGIRGEAFNVGTGAPLSELEMTERVLRSMDRTELSPRIRAASSDAIVHQSLAADKLREATGWMPAHELDDGLARTVAWYRDYL
jgi:CDP-glucose 4,6-dehydratase